MKKFFHNFLICFLIYSTVVFAGEIITKTDNPDALNEELRVVKESSKDGTLADNSDEKVPTEQAVKTYVDTQLDAYIPAGMIMLWSGTEATIPSGWVLCDGTNSTPDLTDCFVMGAGDTYVKGNTGGATTITLEVANLPAHDHSVSLSSDTHNHSDGTLATDSEANHTHTVPMSNSGEHGTVAGTLYYAVSTTTSSSNGGHSHDVTGSTGNDTHTHTVTESSVGSGTAKSVINPYYALCYIMKT